MKRYDKKDPEFPQYMDFVFRLKINSFILSPNNQSPIANSQTFFRNKTNLQNELYKIVGNDKGQIVDNWGATLPAYLPSAESKLIEIEQEFNSFCEQKINLGFAKPENWPSELLERRLKTEAKHDILILEKERIEKELSEYQGVIEIADDSQLLKNGPKGSGVLKGGKLQSIDGMTVAENKEGLRYINDDRPKAAQFNGYLVSDYYTHICEKWKKACSRKAMEIQQQINEGKTLLSEVSAGKQKGSVSWPSFPDYVVKQEVKQEVK